MRSKPLLDSIFVRAWPEALPKAPNGSSGLPRTDTTEVSFGAVVWSTVKVVKILSDGSVAASLLNETELASVDAATDPTDETADSNDARTAVTDVLASVAWSVRSLRPSRWFAARLKLNRPI